MKANPKDYMYLLLIYKAGIRSGVLDSKDLIDFADKIILAEPDPDYFFIELSLSGKDRNKIILLISEFIKNEGNLISGSYILAEIRHKYIRKEINLKQSVKILYNLKDECSFNGEQEAWIYWIDDQYYLAVDNIGGSIEQVERELLDFLEKYKEFSL